MPKIILSVLVILSLTLFLALPVQSQEVTPCERVHIRYEPKVFLENSASDIELRFTIIDPALLRQLNNRSVRLRFGIGPLPHQLYDSNPTTITSNSFLLTLDNPILEGGGAHSGQLQWQPNPTGDFVPLCSNVVYEVGTNSACTIDPRLPTRIPPNSTLSVRFLGLANTRYRLEGLPTAPVVITDNQGQGVFNGIFITGGEGQVITLTLVPFERGRRGFSCSKNFTISLTAPPPPPPPTGPVAPITPPPQAVPRGNPTIGAAQICDDTQPSIIQTAIGCVHTEPGLFLKDLLTFVISIAGAIAFILMLFGAFQMITSAGNPDNLKTGQELFTNAIIGLLFIAFSVLLMQIIGVDILNIPGLSR